MRYRNVTRTLENLAAGDVVLSQDDLAEIDAIQQKFPVHGGRYVDSAPPEALKLWG